MKYIIYIAALLLLTSCLGANNEVKQAKKDLGVVENNVDKGSDIPADENLEESSQDSLQEDVSGVSQEKSILNIEYIGENKLLSIDDLDLSKMLDGELKITGKTLEQVDSITVNFRNDSSSYPDDSYTLLGFKSGDERFLYNAFSDHEVLDFGTNIYEIIAKGPNKTSKVEVKVLLEKETSQERRSEKFQDETVVAEDFPILEKYGHPVDIGGNKITYSDIKGLEVGKIQTNYFEEICNSDRVTSFLTDNVDGWFYWNTCRDILHNKGLGVFVVRIDKQSDEYIYEKHYYISHSGVYGVIELERGDAVEVEDLAELNKVLKEKNKDFSITTIVDNLFSEL